MTHVVDSAIVDGIDVDKSGVRSMMKNGLRFRVASVSDVQNGDYSAYWGIEIGAVPYDRSTSSVAAHDGVQTLVDSVGTRFIRAATTLYAGLNPRGEWDSGTTYAKNDSVSLDGTSYVSRVDSNLNNSPDSSPTEWQVLSIGTPGEQGDPGSSDVVGTSTTSLEIGTGSKAFTVVETNRGWGVGARLRASSAANVANWMEGVIASYSGTSLSLTVDLVGGSGTHADWTFNIAGEPGEDGAPGANGSDGADGVVQSIVAGTGVTVDDTDPANPIISATGGGGGDITNMADRSSVYYAPTTSTDPDWLYSEFPASSGHGNTVFGSGGPETSNANFVRNTIFGSLALRAPSVADRNEAIGFGALRWGQTVERNTAVGSLSMQWLSDDPADLATHHHDFWQYDPGSGVVLPGEVGWDFFGLETRNPGIGAQIAAVTTGAADSTEAARNVGLGRDALVDIIKGVGNTAVGYRSVGLHYVGDYNTGCGYEAVRDTVFGQNNTGLGKWAGAQCQEGDDNLYLGIEAGFDLITGSRNVFIGPYAGAGITSDDDVFVLANNDTSDPLMVGDFALGHFGFNVALSDIATNISAFDDASGNHVWVVDPFRRLILNHTESEAAQGFSPQFQCHGTAASSGAAGFYRWSNNGGGASFLLNKSRGAGAGDFTTCTSGDEIGVIRFGAADGTGIIAAASIRSLVDGTPGTNDMPGRLEFMTTADGASTSTLRMTIDSAGRVIIAIAGVGNYTSDANASAGGVPVGGLYRNGSALQIRVT
jgi:hypothetical protein